MSPRLAIVDQARTRFASLCEMAISEAARNVTPPMRATTVPATVPRSTGARRRTRYTPAFTMVLECRRAETGVGATMAPSSHEEKGICADFVNPAKASSTAGRRAAPFSIETRWSSSTVPRVEARRMMAPANARPPSMLSVRARNALPRDSVVPLYPMRRKEQRVVTSQKRSRSGRLLEKNTPNMAERNRNWRKKNSGCRSRYSL